MNQALLDLIRAINEASFSASSSDIQRYQFISTLCLADVSPEAMTRVADLPVGPQAKVKALFNQIKAAPALTAASAAEPLRPAVAALTRIYAKTQFEGLPPQVHQELIDLARKTWRGAPSFEAHKRNHLDRLSALVMKESWSAYFKDLVVAPEDAEHLFPFSDKAWQRLASMHGEGRIQVLQGDLTKADGAMAGLAKALREAGVPLAAFYASNSVQHFGTVPDNLYNFFTNMEAFTWAENPVVLLTGTSRLLPSLLTKAQEEDAAAGRDVFTYHALSPDQLRHAVWTR